LRFPPLSQAEDNPEGEETLIRHGDAKEYNMATEGIPQKRTTHALEGGIITEIAACSLKDCNLKNITSSYL